MRLFRKKNRGRAALLKAGMTGNKTAVNLQGTAARLQYGQLSLMLVKQKQPDHEKQPVHRYDLEALLWDQLC